MFEKAILSCHFLAYLLHSKYKGERLNYEQKKKAWEWLQKINSVIPIIRPEF